MSDAVGNIKARYLGRKVHKSRYLQPYMDVRWRPGILQRSYHTGWFDSPDSDDEEDPEQNVQHVLKHAGEFARAAEILRAQATARNPIWMSSITKRNVGKDVKSGTIPGERGVTKKPIDEWQTLWDTASIMEANNYCCP
ncbi:hypothetical protein B0H14DRAFT_2625561 [Mycena olivaceomarginata]|nr:hypothetical protein B0H14DRAFT_2625561 [Mycena olivaceomarginata]